MNQVASRLASRDELQRAPKRESFLKARLGSHKKDFLGNLPPHGRWEGTLADYFISL